ncbi:LPXTG cell wall anchor domain-containing protein [Brevibacterium gallinarum]|uniref:LPXTG cell wall anchor domain-containing protein n=1 Tax=Brevibacterium gallinarum TaxID=2762220 RepID=A0ABR8WU80_9MICO|nr:LPXTG cell wall anchor domain-containing protein [Brevibacterium gallinarum]MBD8020630.1 LPXTG cell wall anchor domain-containing protein [Brevibacterium gallinarum]
MKKIPALLVAGAVTAAPFVGTAAAHAATPVDTSGPEQEQKRELTFKLKSQTIKDDSTYGLVEEYRFDVTNSGDVPADGTLRAFNDKDESYIDDEGQEMWLACDWIFPGLEPGRTITCTMQVRIVDSELAAGKTDPQQVHFRGFKGQEEAFTGFTTESLPIPEEFLSEDEGDDSEKDEDAPGEDETDAPEETPAPEDDATDDDGAGDKKADEDKQADDAADEDEKSNDAKAGSDGANKPDDAKRASGTLPRTGSETTALAAGGAALLVIGGAAVAVTMRRRADRG